MWDANHNPADYGENFGRGEHNPFTAKIDLTILFLISPQLLHAKFLLAELSTWPNQTE
jgi:hypothetical protein